MSIQANRLRKALERYSLVAGGNDPIRIEIPKGTYVPVFHVQPTHGSDKTPAPRASEVIVEKWKTLGHMGRIEEGKKAADALLKLKPDFPSRGRVLIGYFTEFEDIFERMVEGLHKVGLDVE